MWTKESHVNQDTNTLYWDSQWQESHNSTLGELFRGLQLEYGRCVSKIYRDRQGGSPIQVGWVFHKRVEYEDRPGKYYIREVWAEISLIAPQRALQWTQPPVSPWEKNDPGIAPQKAPL